MNTAFCLLLGQSAVHAGLSGRTNIFVSFWNHQRALEQRGHIDRSAAGHAVDMR
jgi:hypothetical protein